MGHSPGFMKSTGLTAVTQNIIFLCTIQRSFSCCVYIKLLLSSSTQMPSKIDMAHKNTSVITNLYLIQTRTQNFIFDLEFFSSKLEIKIVFSFLFFTKHNPFSAKKGFFKSYNSLWFLWVFRTI